MWEAIESNRRRTWFIVAGMAVLLVLLGALIGNAALMILMAVMMGAIVLIAEIFLRGNFLGGRRRSSSKDTGGLEIALFVLAILLAILAPILAQMMYFACSRRREYLADASGAR